MGSEAINCCDPTLRRHPWYDNNVAAVLQDKHAVHCVFLEGSQSSRNIFLGLFYPILDLASVPEEGAPTDALRNACDLAEHAEK